MTIGPLRYCPKPGHSGGKDCGCWVSTLISQVCDVTRHSECDFGECSCPCHVEGWRPDCRWCGGPCEKSDMHWRGDFGWNEDE